MFILLACFLESLALQFLTDYLLAVASRPELDSIEFAGAGKATRVDRAARILFFEIGLYISIH